MLALKDKQERWDDPKVESMYDKNLLRAEISLIKGRLKQGWKILDAGCGEGEGTSEYSTLPGVKVTGVDKSSTRLTLARQRTNNVQWMQADLREWSPDLDYDCVISQRFLINLESWEEQKKVLSTLSKSLKPGGVILLMEGSKNGARELNEVRKCFDLPPIDERDFNLFLEDEKVINHLHSQKMYFSEETGLGAYLLLTRGIQPALTNSLNWYSEFNRKASSIETHEAMGLNGRFSRVKLWVFRKV